LAHMAHHWRLTKASSTTDRWRVTCSCGGWRAFTETEVDAHRLAEEHGREKGAHIVKIESRDDYRRRGMDVQTQHPRSI
jgi:hypothetical protein